MPENQFVRNTHLTAIARAYRNSDSSLIADAVLPYSGVSAKTFRYYTYPLGQAYTVPATDLTEQGEIPQLKIRGTEVSATCTDRGLEVPLSNDELSEAAEGNDPKEVATVTSSSLLMLDREKRVADLVLNPANYDADHKVNLSGAPWSNDANDPITVIRQALDECMIRPNVFAIGRLAWTKVANVIRAAFGSSAVSGVVTPARFAELIEVGEVLVGEALINTAPSDTNGTVTLSRLWGKHALAFYRNREAITAGGLTFGFTARLHNERIAQTRQIQMGLRGGIGVQVGETAKEVIIAPDCAFLFQNTVA